ncbi:hypothetical protein JDW21_19660 [Bacillus subtilis]|uniref:Structural protein n=1 Tax=Bacillus phage vB_BsuS_PJN02 TaxID=2920374 RepID=A0AC61TRQ8_9CAUD|nr:MULTISPECIES: hypothetical protein [Bacillus subtilis group]YP_010681660.1 putative structural protein [Bacillus phage vB_BsuS_PJN02]MCR4361970.1 hypothetical protein [Bacillus subtilis]UNH58385.1 putative structural protein [Bacillus phage vB_BsuS_PJN02]UQB84213.1 hypothetical protein KMZ31_20025 [Bacillus amyloliquefaciens]WOF32836.1 hypothetical protein OEJ84_23280 [Bacillus subtilis]
MTYLAELYDIFLTKITDYRLLNMTEQEIEDDLYGYFKSARARFYRCRSNLNILDDANGIKFFGYRKDTIHQIRKDKDTNGNIIVLDTLEAIALEYDVSIDIVKTRNSISDDAELANRRTLYITDALHKVTLTSFEIEVLVNLMLVEHIKPQLISSENLKQSLSDKDFKIYSQANQLREIRLLLEKLQKDTNKMIVEYTFFDLDKERM